MAIPKTIGIETELGIVLRGAEESNPISASSLLINAYLYDLANTEDHPSKVGWDFEDESPGNDARGSAPVGSLPPDVETHLVNAVLTNGARYYVDHAHPELSTPECADARAVVVFDRAAERIIERSMTAAKKLLPPGQELVAYKNNSDGKGNSYGCHENYLMERQTPFGRIVAHATTHFVSRQIFTGAGKVGTEAKGLTAREVPFQLTQRADFFEEEVGLETTLKRPIINTRDEPHADATKYRRLHVIVGDANMSEISTFLKVGTTAFVLAMVEDDFLPLPFILESPVQAMRQVSYDLTLRKPLRLTDGSTVTALEMQWDLYDRAQKYAVERGTENLGGPVADQILIRWESVLTQLESDPMKLADQLDWVAKYRLIRGYQERNNLPDGDARLAAMDLQYHDLRPDKSLFRRLGVETLANEDEINHATTHPPLDTRAYFRGECLRRWSDQIVAANWDSLVFDIGEEPLRRVPMMEPRRGTAEHVATLFEECSSPRELLERLSGG